MSKIGRYSADRKKFEHLSSDKTVTVADCGTIFTLNSGTAGDGTYTVTLPAIADANEGWWCKLVVREITGGNITLSAAAADAGTISTHVVSCTDAVGWHAEHLGAVLADESALSWQTASWCQNDTLELVTDGVTWCGQAILSSSMALSASA